MNASKARLDIAVGLFLLLAFATLLVLAVASTNGRLPIGEDDTYSITARFSNIAELRIRAPVKIGGVSIGEIARVDLDPKTFEAVVTLNIRRSAGDIPADSSAGIYTAGLLGDRYIGITPGGDVEALGPGDEILLTQSAVVLEQLISKFMFGSADKSDKSDKSETTKEETP